MDATNQRLAAALDELAALLSARKVDRYRVRAYERAAATIRGLPVSIASLSPEAVRRLEGVGAALASIIAEFLEHDRIGRLEELRAEEPAGMGELLRLPLLGIRDARALSGDHGIVSVQVLRDLLATSTAGEVIGDRLAGRARESLRRLDNLDRGQPLTLARRAQRTLADKLAEIDCVRQVLNAGELRRGCETVERLGVVLEVDDVTAAGAAIAQHAAVLEVVAADEVSYTVVTTGGWLADLQVTSASTLGMGLLLGTGSDRHLAQIRAHARTIGVEVVPDGIKSVAGTTAVACEERAFELLDLQVIAPELREGDGEVAAAAHGALPQLVERGDILGDLHVHTDWSRDGKATLDAMVEAAIAAGHRYVALTDHAENLTINGMPREKVLQRREAILEARQRYPDIEILDAAELNIGLDGGLDYDLEFLCTFDLTVASIHSHMDRPITVQTDRILTALAHPAVDVIGHPTGRILGHRPAYAIELEAIAAAAAETGTALEVNGSPRRLDLSSQMVRAAISAGATIAVSSDAHNEAELDNLAGGVTVARRGWATAADVLNALPVPDLRRRVAAKRAAAG